MPDEIIAEALFSEEDIAALLKRELTLAMGRTTSSGAPQAILLAGQPGAGKTELSTMVISTLERNAVFINGDDYRRYHPAYRTLYAKYGSDVVSATSAFSSTVTEQMIQRVSDQRRHLVIEGTGRTVDVPRSTAELLSAKGYDVQIAVIAARPEVSLASTLLRFCRMNEGGTIPRATALSAHDAVVDALPGNLDVLLDCDCISRIRIWNRVPQLIYDSAADSGRPSDALLRFWHSKWTQQEVADAELQMALLRKNEQLIRLGQQEVLNELAQRLKNVAQY